MRQKKHLFIICMLWVCSLTIAAQTKAIQTGADQMERYLPSLVGKRVGIVMNHTSLVSAKQICLLDTLLRKNINVIKVFAPEHGIRGNADAGEKINHGVDQQTGTPIISLYGKNKKPTREQISDIDIVVFDLQDVGARFYTYISTMYYIMEACAENNKPLIILDRPNPCDYVAGPVLDLAFRSFVGMLPIPVLHGCTVGELACMINGEKWMRSGTPPCNLQIVTVEGWKHQQFYDLPVKPSPNLPNAQAIRLYPSLCPFEGTNISVGRGTTTPFQMVGGLDKRYGSFTFIPRSLPGFAKNPPLQNQICYGVDLRNNKDIRGFHLDIVIRFYQASKLGEKFFARARMFDLLLGTDKVRKAILAGKSAEEIEHSWKKDLEAYQLIRKKYLLYP